MKTKYQLVLFTILCGLLLATAFLLGVRPVEASILSAANLIRIPAPEAGVISNLGPEWETQCANCPFYAAMTNNTILRMDSQGRLQVAFGFYRMYYGLYDGGAWQLEVVDDQTIRGNFSSLALDAEDNPHIAYRDYYSQAVFYAHKDANGWHRETVDHGDTDPYDDGGFTSIAIDLQGRPHILYRIFVNDDVQALMHAYRDANGWHKETVDANGNMGWMNSMVIDANGYVHVTYVDQTNSDGDLSRLLYAYQDATGWHYGVIEDGITDNNANQYGGSSLVLAADGQPVVAYRFQYPDNTKVVRLARLDEDGMWTKEDAYTGSLAWWAPSMVLDDSGYAHILHGGMNQTLLYTFEDSGGWHTQAIDDMIWNSDCNSLAQGEDGTLYAFYKATDNEHWDVIAGDNLVLATLAPASSTWVTETVAPYGSAGEYSQMVMDADDHPHLTSQDSSSTVRYAYWDGAAWHDEIVALDADGDFNNYAFSSLALDAAGDPHVAYINEYHKWLLYGSGDESGWTIEQVPGVFGTSFKLKIRGDGNPLIAFGGGSLGIAYKEGGTWYTEIISTTSAEELSMQMDNNGHPHLSFNAGGALWYAYQNTGGSWNFEKVNTPETVNSSYGLTSLVLNTSAHPYIAHVSTSDLGKLQVVVSYKEGAAWTSTVIETDVSGYPELALDSQGYPHVVYMGKSYGDYPEFKQDLRYAYQDEDGWHYQTLDVLMMTMKGSPQIELDSQDRAYISYADYNYLLVLSKTAPPDVVNPTLPNEPGSDSPLISPAEGSILDTSQPFFDWTDGQDNVGVISYTLTITREGGQGVQSTQATVYQVTTSESWYIPDFNLPGGSYSWTVRAIDLTGNASAWAEAHQFTIGGGSPTIKIYLPFVARK
jgi:hypothetical protein